MFRTFILSALTATLMIGCELVEDKDDTGAPETDEAVEAGPTMPQEGTWEVTAIETDLVECGIWFVEDPADMLPHDLTHEGESGFALYDVNGGYDCVIADDDTFTCEGASDGTYTLDVYGTIDSESSLTMSGYLTGPDCVDESDFTFQRID